MSKPSSSFSNFVELQIESFAVVHFGTGRCTRRPLTCLESLTVNRSFGNTEVIMGFEPCKTRTAPEVEAEAGATMEAARSATSTMAVRGRMGQPGGYRVFRNRGPGLLPGRT